MKSGLIVENFRPIADILKLVLNSVGIECVTIIENSDDVAPFLEINSPDIILMDINLSGKKNGIELTKDIQKSVISPKVIVVSFNNEPHYLKSSFDAGAVGYFVKNSSLNELNYAIKKVLNGEIYICESMLPYIDVLSLIDKEIAH